MTFGKLPILSELVFLMCKKRIRMVYAGFLGLLKGLNELRGLNRVLSTMPDTEQVLSKHSPL